MNLSTDIEHKDIIDDLLIVDDFIKNNNVRSELALVLRTLTSCLDTIKIISKKYNLSLNDIEVDTLINYVKDEEISNNTRD
jgi:hypothetical protein